MTSPWSDTNLTSHQKALQTLKKASIVCMAKADTHKALRTDLRAFAASLETIHHAFAQNETYWRANRALSVVHLPAFLAILERLDGVEAGDRAPLETDLRACMQAMQGVEAHIKQRKTETLMIEVEHLRETLALSSEALPAPKASAGWFGGLMSKGQDHLTTLTDTTTAGLRAGQETLKRGTKAVSKLGGNLAATGLATLHAPVTNRLGALREALIVTSTTAIIATGVTALLFPPAVPFVTGLVLLEAPDAYQEALKNAATSSQQASQARSSERGQLLQEVAALLSGGPPLVRLETPYVLATIDTVQGRSDVMILAGQHTGSVFGDLDLKTRKTLINTAPDAQTKDILMAWERGHA